MSVKRHRSRSKRPVARGLFVRSAGRALKGRSVLDRDAMRRQVGRAWCFDAVVWRTFGARRDGGRDTGLTPGAWDGRCFAAHGGREGKCAVCLACRDVAGAHGDDVAE